MIEDIAGDEAGPTAGQTTGQTTGQPSNRESTHDAATGPAGTVVKSSAGASKGLGITALILGALGLLVGLVAFATARRKAAG